MPTGLSGGAIYGAGDLSEKWGGCVRANADFFVGLGSPCGARRMGGIDRDGSLVEQLPFES
ncbi:hypothetical protein [Mycobacteroides abscessus]|uniref:hypothetical protein n=1 Tax=Mycobacteroides abscessus TaxID=36809 RepID=UPI0009C9968F|nr:Probable ferredoxin FdxC [Mycobacteroides abscessus subsp. bolletii]SKG14969.1 Probable ferredoxin FdxC [Mycobacteroides abscessus subsp. bolletii]SKI64769.1 Probable ferredoxin FdxC [Mycobacteroides abscessus subsp. bolletii]SKJ32481.1 Probable ferredoxin FdxC [Mycobacteroides abscessus subsp. bolletii]SKJ58335.1 Probable ferredoxin FdxC [Mycobacteroides abscessus subsp. bolletii]